MKIKFKLKKELNRLIVQLRGRVYFPIIYFFRTFGFIAKSNKIDKQNLISILCPSRERPKNLERFLININEYSSKHSRIELVVYVDNDDPLLSSYSNIYNNYQKSDNKINYKLLIGEPKSVSKSWNDIAKIANGDIFIMGNDDCIFETKNWDKILDKEVAKFPDKIFVMWFNDGLRAHMYGDFPIVSRQWYNVLGYFTPGCFEFIFNDTWIIDIGRRVKRLHYIKKVKLTHLHVDIGLQKKDNTWAKNRSGESKNIYQRDEEKFNNTSYERDIDSKKILKYIKKEK